MITEKSNQLQVIMITDYDYPISGRGVAVVWKKDFLKSFKIAGSTIAILLVFGTTTAILF